MQKIVQLSAPPADSYSALFPGEHKIIFSEEGLRVLLRRCHIPFCYIDKRRLSNLVVYASLSSPPVDRIRFVQALCNEHYAREYLYSFRAGNASRPGLNKRLQLAMLYRLFKDFVNTVKVQDAIELLSEMIPDLRREVDQEFSDINNQKPEGVDEVLRQSLAICSLSLCKERILIQDLGLAYPAGSVAFGKNLGFFIANLIHQMPNPPSEFIMHSAIIYLESFVSYALSLRSAVRADYHLETISLIGPAICSLMLFKLKTNQFLCKELYCYVYEDWFSLEYPQSYEEILSYLEISRAAQISACAAMAISDSSDTLELPTQDESMQPRVNKAIKVISRKFSNLFGIRLG